MAIFFVDYNIARKHWSTMFTKRNMLVNQHQKFVKVMLGSSYYFQQVYDAMLG